jgi:hypothetical protein
MRFSTTSKSRSAMPAIAASEDGSAAPNLSGFVAGESALTGQERPRCSKRLGHFCVCAQALVWKSGTKQFVVELRRRMRPACGARFPLRPPHAAERVGSP